MQEVFLSGSKSAKATSWQDVIEVAEERIKSLQAAIGIFESYRDSGEPFISSNAKKENQ